MFVSVLMLVLFVCALSFYQNRMRHAHRVFCVVPEHMVFGCMWCSDVVFFVCSPQGSARISEINGFSMIPENLAEPYADNDLFLILFVYIVYWINNNSNGVHMFHGQMYANS